MIKKTHRTWSRIAIFIFSAFAYSIGLSFSFAAKPFVTQQWQTKNGVQVVFYQAMEVPMLDISIAFKAGSAYDGEAFGLSTLTTRLLNQGSIGLDADSLATKLADTGAQYTGENGRDMVVLSLKTLTEARALKTATDLFSTIIAHPDFQAGAFEREKKQQLVAIAQQQESPDEVANQLFFQTLYQNHPYAHPVIGTHQTVMSLNLEQVQAFYNRFFISNQAIMVLVGAIDQSTAKQLAEHLTQDLLQGKPIAEIPMAHALTKEMNVKVPFPSSQTIVRLGQLGVTHHDKRYFPLLVGNYILGGGSLVSQLAHELRETRGLTYGVYSQLAPMPGIGPYLISFSTKHSQTATAIQVIRTTLQSFIQQGPSEQELLAAKQYLTGSYPLSLGSNRSIADMLLKIAFYHLPKNYLQTYVEHIHAVTTQAIKQSFQELITPNALLEVAVGPS